MGKKLITTVEHTQDEYVQVYKKHTHYIPFTLWGKIGTIMNIVKVMLDMTKPEQRFFDQLIDALDTTTHMSKLEPAKTKSEGIHRSSTAKLLINKGLIKRVSPGVWMINPELLVPDKNNRDYVIQYWSTL
jgi:ADP-glucose pyrophosphorylase